MDSAYMVNLINRGVVVVDQIHHILILPLDSGGVKWKSDW